MGINMNGLNLNEIQGEGRKKSFINGLYLNEI
jgi:hypothetical protein